MLKKDRDYTLARSHRVAGRWLKPGSVLRITGSAATGWLLSLVRTADGDEVTPRPLPLCRVRRRGELASLEPAVRMDQR